MPTTYAIPNGATVFAASTYTGNGVTGQSIVNSGNNTTGVTFKPDFVWVKVRSTAATDHYLADSVRGATKYLQSDTTAVEGTNNGITAFNSNGFSVGALGDTNTNGATIVGWQWQAGQGTTTTIAAGSISSGVPSVASTVSVNTTAKFSVVTYTFSTSATNTVGHGLGAAPAFIIMKDRTTAYNWDVYHQSVGYTQRLILNSTAAAGAGFWSATPTDTVFSVTTSAYTNNDNIVAYCWAEVAGFSKFGSYTGNGSADGPFVYLGFRPRYVMMKNTSVSESWYVFDSSRDTYNAMGNGLFPNLPNAETGSYPLDFLSNGFKLRVAGNPNNANTYIYAAFAENPFKYANAR